MSSSVSPPTTWSFRPLAAAGLLLLLLMVLGSLRVEAQPAVATPAPPVTAPLHLELQDTGEGITVRLEDLLRTLRSLDATARIRWDSRRGVVRIEVGSHTLDAFLEHKVVLLDGRVVNVPRTVTASEGRVLIPLDSVKVLLKALNLDFEYQAATAGSPTLAPASTDPATSPALAAPPAVGLPPRPAIATPVPPPSLSGFAPSTSIDLVTTAPSAPAVALPPMTIDRPTSAIQTESPSGPPALRAPDGLVDKIGLNWSQLIDARHQWAPERITLVCDSALDPIGRRVQEKLTSSGRFQVQRITPPSPQRDQAALSREVAASRPDLLVDLMALPENAEQGPLPPLWVWTVHEALWPMPPADDSDPRLQTYRAHEYQNLALGALLSGELLRQWPDRPCTYELAPSYLLRRVDAPAAAVLIPVVTEGEDSADADERMARAVYAALVDYADGIRSQTFQGFGS